MNGAVEEPVGGAADGAAPGSLRRGGAWGSAPEGAEGAEGAEGDEGAEGAEAAAEAEGVAGAEEVAEAEGAAGRDGAEVTVGLSVVRARCTVGPSPALPPPVGAEARPGPATGAPRPGRGRRGAGAAGRDGVDVPAGAARPGSDAGTGRPGSGAGAGPAVGAGPPAAALSATRRCTGASRPPLAAGECVGRPLDGATGDAAGGAAGDRGPAVVVSGALPVVGSGAELPAVRELSGAGVRGAYGPGAVARCTGGRVPAPDVPEGPPRSGDTADGEGRGGEDGGVADVREGVVAGEVLGEAAGEAGEAGEAGAAGRVALGAGAGTGEADVDRWTAGGAGEADAER